MEIEQQIPSWHFLFVGFVLVFLGSVAHVIRGFVNLYPDKISGNDTVNILFSEGYDALDHFLGVEYTDYGFYDLYSGKSLRVSITLWLVFGYVAYLCYDDPAGLSALIGDLFEWIGNRFVEQ